MKPVRVATTAVLLALVTAGCSSTDPVATPASVQADEHTTEEPTGDTIGTSTTEVDSELGSEVDDLLAGLEDDDFSGVVSVQHGDALVTRGFGLADRDAATPVDPDTVFDIGSVTKQFTGAAIVRLEMDGLVSVDDPISKYVTGLPEELAGATLHQLLTHTAGLAGGLGDDYEPIGRDDFVALVAQTPLVDTPGSQHLYSNVGYSLLTMVIETVTGESYEAYLRRVFFEPTEMDHTGYVLPDWTDQTIAVGYDAPSGDSNGKPNELPWSDDGPYWHLRGNGGILSTAEDMLRWDQALRGNDILDEAAKQKLFAPHVPEGPGAPTSYGYGWVVYPYGDERTLLTHDGSNGVFFANFLRFVDDDLTIYTVTNATQARHEGLAFQIADSILGTSLMSEFGAAPDPCGFSDLDLATVEAFPAVDQLPDTGVGRLTANFLDVLADGDDAAVLEFATDHVSLDLVDAPAAERAEAIEQLQVEFAGDEVLRIHEESPLILHVYFSGPRGDKVLSVGLVEAEPTRMRCFGSLAI